MNKRKDKTNRIDTNMIKLDKKGLTGEAIKEAVMWIIFLAIAGFAVWFIVKKIIG